VATLSEKVAELEQAKADLAAASLATSYSQGDRQVARANITELRRRVAALSREVNELTACGQSANNPLILTASWE